MGHLAEVSFCGRSFSIFCLHTMGPAARMASTSLGRTLALQPPKLDKGAALPVYGIRSWQRDCSDSIISGGSLSGTTAEQVGDLSGRVSSDDVKVRAAS